MSAVFDPGKDDREEAQAEADRGIIEGTSTTGPGGISASTSNVDGQQSTDLSLGSFDPLLGGLQGLAQGGIDQAGQTFQEGQQHGDFQGLGDIFQSSLATAQADPFDLGADISSRLRALSERRNNRQVNRTFNRLQAGGNLGSSAGVRRAGDLERNIMEQGMKFDLAGLQAGQSLQADAFGRVQGASQGRTSIGDAFLRNQAQGANIAFGGTAAATGLARMPLDFLAAGGAEATRSSNTRFSAAGIDLEASAMAKSPLLEAINMGAGIASSFTTGGLASDKRLKDNIVRLGEGDGLRWYQWTWNDLAAELSIDAPTTGLIAQEVQENYPEAVNVMDNGYLCINYAILDRMI